MRNRNSMRRAELQMEMDELFR